MQIWLQVSNTRIHASFRLQVVVIQFIITEPSITLLWSHFNSNIRVFSYISPFSKDIRGGGHFDESLLK